MLACGWETGSAKWDERWSCEKEEKDALQEVRAGLASPSRTYSV